MPDIGLFDLAIFLVGAFAAAFVTGLAGFAFGLVAAAIWLHALTPVQVVALIVAYALLVQGYAVWKLKQALNIGRLIPFIVGSAVGIPVGVIILKWASPSDLRIAVGLLLLLFSLYNFIRPKLPQVKQAGSLLDAIVGMFNGLLAGSTGLGGILPTIWSGVRGWSKDEQRAVFQPTAVATFLMTIVWLGGAGTITADIGRLFAIGLPVLIAGTWLGWKLYGRIDEATFRKVVLFVLLASGVSLLLAS
ncbi:MAG: sulfite exporter TauE/SafE family protein [Gammaproteobacteria bacterium]|nr:sulfite exporter TauE/SafE family protein [Rhodocyclaceae bacterium]MBU3909229.1 sulfite exporter TauE/SafE family protein [Gammaproteobacteria bacterium]MBU3989663.1 sulfite exporter TauE/SafE family protein [Gammaproteobacteria bacterium]MBU4005611.1 sulfite exporter TauE/SafE family protein [Gammaproteobacteria bacterium]MBU4020836.1 sulfite exporter TauE/SafE family protein [Gammaproteobacteria bacterium]